MKTMRSLGGGSQPRGAGEEPLSSVTMKTIEGCYILSGWLGVLSLLSCIEASWNRKEWFGKLCAFDTAVEA
jgi:hypothetical protein